MEKAIKSLGQNFLEDTSIVKKMVELLPFQSSDVVLEIGPGKGVFTDEIITHLGTNSLFYAIELDARFFELLTRRYINLSNVKIIHDNFLDWIRETSLNGNLCVLGSIPYYITSPIIHRLLEAPNKPKAIVLMMQKEVAEKVAEKNVKANYFSMFVKTFYDVEYVDTVLRTKFTPVPKVDSAILYLSLKNTPLENTPENIFLYEKFLHKGFRFSKKMLNKSFDKTLLDKVGLMGNERPHEVPLSTWLTLYNEYIQL